jgi:hypothetical protein
MPNNEYSAHNRAAAIKCRAQLAAGEITDDDCRWLTGPLESDPVYLAPLQRKKKAHIVSGDDTLCKAGSGGSIDVRRYKRSKHLGLARLCANCRQAAG